MKRYLQIVTFLVVNFIIIIVISSVGNVTSRRPVTLIEAIRIAEEEAGEWSSDATVTQIISTDAGDMLSESNGKSGKRNCWNIMFSSDSMDSEYNIFVIDGKAEYAIETLMPAYDAIDLGNVTLDSPDALKIAKTVGVEPVPEERGWAVGYHYSLQFLTQIETNQVFLAMLVYGETEQGNFCYVAIDPQSHQIVSFMERTGFTEDGRSIWEEQLGE